MANITERKYVGTDYALQYIGESTAELLCEKCYEPVLEFIANHQYDAMYLQVLDTPLELLNVTSKAVNLVKQGRTAQDFTGDYIAQIKRDGEVTVYYEDRSAFFIHFEDFPLIVVYNPLNTKPYIKLAKRMIQSANGLRDLPITGVAWSRACYKQISILRQTDLHQLAWKLTAEVIHSFV
jgi:hypothetical protein